MQKSLSGAPAGAFTHYEAAPDRRWRDVVGFYFVMFLQWRERIRNRRVLAALDERTLRDIGMTRGSAAFEAGKPFWKA